MTYFSRLNPGNVEFSHSEVNGFLNGFKSLREIRDLSRLVEVLQVICR